MNRRLWILLAGLLLLLAGTGVIAWAILQDGGEPELTEFRPPAVSIGDAQEEQEVSAGEQSAITAEKSSADGVQTYVSPVDFQALQKLNPDIIAWLDIPGTETSYPVCQSENDAFYLDHNWLGETSASGALFTERNYNASDFSDPVNVIYGHNMRDRTMFGDLQPTYCVESNLETYGTVILYLPTREVRYRIFAAVPFDDSHLLSAYDFSNSRTFRLFFKSVFRIRALDAAFRSVAYTENQGNVLVLSTCCDGSAGERYLVFARSAGYCANTIS